MAIIIQYLKEELWSLLNKLKFAKCSQTFIQKGWQEGVVFSIAGALSVCLLPLHPMERRCWVACFNSRSRCTGHSLCSEVPDHTGTSGHPTVLDEDIAAERPACDHLHEGHPTVLVVIAPDQSLLRQCWMVSLPRYPHSHPGLFLAACMQNLYPSTQPFLHTCAPHVQHTNADSKSSSTGKSAHR